MIFKTTSKPKINITEYHQNINKIDTLISKLQSTATSVIEYYTSLMNFPLPLNEIDIHKKADDFIFTRYLDEDNNLFRNFIYTNYSSTYKSFRLEMPLNESLYDLDSWIDNLSTLQKSRTKRSANHNFQQQSTSIRKIKLTADIFLLDFSDKLFGFYLVITNSKNDFFNFVCNDVQNHFVSIPFSVYLMTDSCNVYISNQLHVFAKKQKGTFDFQPKVVFTGSPIVSKFATNIWPFLDIFNLNFNSWGPINEILQYALFILAFILPYLRKLRKRSRGKKRQNELSGVKDNNELQMLVIDNTHDIPCSSNDKDGNLRGEIESKEVKVIKKKGRHRKIVNVE